ncbi:hypothetical protein HYX19_01295 [Candidatus Woesearchaeota archaeon]|nr:hypothetical protein [Candidatus Woesearchaeota archaeon]
MKLFRKYNLIEEKKMRINMRIEREAEGLDKKALQLVNQYGDMLIDNKPPIGFNLPPSEPCLLSGRYSVEFILIKDFLNKYPEYTVDNAIKLRRHYNLD